jgi:hypothetical protein
MTTGFVYIFGGLCAAGVLAVLGWFAADAFRKMSGSAVILLAGLFIMFLGERVYGYSDYRLAITAAGAGVALFGVGLRVYGMLRSEGGRANAHRQALIWSIVVLASALLYVLTLEPVVTAMGLGDDAAKKFGAAIDSLWPIGVTLGLIPIFLLDRVLAVHPILLPMGAARRAVLSGLSAGLAICLIFPLNYLASVHTKEWDTAYFQTTRPGTSTTALVAGLSAPVKVTVFEPAGNDVGREMEPYFNQLASASGGQLTWEMVDQALAPKTAEELKVRENGYVAFAQGDKNEKVKIGTELEKSKRELKKLDGSVEKTLIKLTRGQRVVYMTHGHGELNTREKDDPFRKLNTFKKLLETQNYTIKDFGATEGSATHVPDDAAAVVIAGPDSAFMPEEIATLKSYWDNGGHLMILTEQGADPVDNLDDLLAYLGVKPGRDVLANANAYASQGRGVADRVMLATNRFGSHDSVKTLSRNSTQLYLVMPTAVGLDKVADTKNKITTLIRTMPGTWADLDGDREQAKTEKDKVFELGMAIDPPDGGGAGRAIVVGDANLISDPVLSFSKGNDVFAYDALRWLVGDEDIAGEVEDEEDVKIVHTREEDQNWFYATTIGVPVLVLGFGFVFVRMRGRKS